MIRQPNLFEYRYYNTDELECFPLGTIFDHKVKGRCWIDQRQKAMGFCCLENAKCLLFECGEKYYFASKKLLAPVVSEPMSVICCPTDVRKLNIYESFFKD